MLRDWSVSHYADDIVAGASTDFMQPSWNWHSLFPVLGRSGLYPLAVISLPTNGTAGSVVPGGAAFYRFAVPAGGRASIALSSASGGGGLMGVLLRIR